MEADLSLPSARLSDLPPAALTVARLIAACRGPLRVDDVRGIAGQADGDGCLGDGEVLSEVRERLAGSGYRLFEADFQVLLCLREHAAGRLPAAVEAAARAYELAWCDGPPFVYHWGLTAARRQLSALGAAPPGAPDPQLEIGGERRPA